MLVYMSIKCLCELSIRKVDRNSMRRRRRWWRGRRSRRIGGKELGLLIAKLDESMCKLTQCIQRIGINPIWVVVFSSSSFFLISIERVLRMLIRCFCDYLFIFRWIFFAATSSSSRTFHFWCTFRKSLNSFGTIITKKKTTNRTKPSQTKIMNSLLCLHSLPSVCLIFCFLHLPNMKQYAILRRIELKLIMNFTK